MKVAQEIDVDNVTIIINPQNKLEAKIPTSTQSEVVIEEVPNVTPSNAVAILNGIARRIIKLGKVNGTEWMVFQLETPTPTPKPKPTITKNIHMEFYDDVGTISDGGYSFTHTGKVRVITEDSSPFTPNDNPIYENYSDSRIEMEVSGNTQKRTNVAMINFNTMTYKLFIAYGDPQTSSVLTNVTSNGANFTVEYEDAIYEYRITSVSVVQNTPAQPELSDIDTYLNYTCSWIVADEDHYRMTTPLLVSVTTSDVGSKTPKTVKFDVTLGSQTRTYSYPYSVGNTYEWNSINDFTYEGGTPYRVENARVEFTDGSSSLPSRNLNSDCIMDLLRD